MKKWLLDCETLSQVSQTEIVNLMALCPNLSSAQKGQYMLYSSILAMNALAWSVVFGVECLRRSRSEKIAVPFTFLLLILAAQLLLFEMRYAFLCAMPLIVLTALREAVYFVQTNRSELSLAGAVGSGGVALGILTWWLVTAIHAEFSLAL